MRCPSLQSQRRGGARVPLLTGTCESVLLYYCNIVCTVLTLLSTVRGLSVQYMYTGTCSGECGSRSTVG